MEAHHKQVAEERVFQLNRVLKDWRSSGVNATLAKMPIFGLIQNIDKVPVKWREDLRNSIGGYLNHIFYFVTMSPNKKGIERNITEVMRSVLMRSFINQSNFEVMFNKTSLELFSNGYVWLVRVPNKRYLTVYTSHTEMNPISFGMQPLLGIDLWEHAYWSKYGNNKEEYIRSWWKLVDFDKVEQVLNWWWSFDPYDPKHHDVPDYEYDEL
jgi:Fe-Mn family superoxide dismutase